VPRHSVYLNSFIGKTRSEGGKAKDADLSLPTLLADFLGIINHIWPEPKESPSLLVRPDLIQGHHVLTVQLLGHSMGAAPILSASPELQAKGYQVPGVIVLDVVEGGSQAFAASTTDSRHRHGGPTDHEVHPSETPLILPVGCRCRALAVSSPASQITARLICSVSSHSIRNAESARVSVPSYIVPESSHSTRQVWRTDLLATEPFWAGEHSSLHLQAQTDAKSGMPASAPASYRPSALDCLS
jgi:protein phosphatase methylesterase 1